MRKRPGLFFSLLLLISTAHALPHDTQPKSTPEICGARLFESVPHNRLLRPAEVENSILVLIQNDPALQDLFLERHTLRFLSEVVIASSVLHDRPLPAEAGAYLMASSLVFHDPVQRVRYGDAAITLTEDETQDLTELLALLDGGKYTLSHTDVLAWAQALKKQTDFLKIATPELAFEVLIDQIHRNRILPNEPRMQAQLVDFSRRIYNEMTFRRVRSDILRALGPDDDWMRLDYNLFMKQLLTYLSPEASNQEILADHERAKVEEVIEIAQNQLFPPFTVQDFHRIDQEHWNTAPMNTTVEMALRIHLLRQRGKTVIVEIANALRNPTTSTDAMQTVAESFRNRMEAIGYSRAGTLWALSEVEKSL